MRWACPFSQGPTGMTGRRQGVVVTGVPRCSGERQWCGGRQAPREVLHDEGKLRDVPQ
jgi:hypothetical protein